MKRIVLFFLSLSVLSSALYYHQTQKALFNKTRGLYHDFQRELKVIEGDVAFLKENHHHLTFLAKKGWFIPRSRLVGGREIHQWATSLNAVRFRVEPETTRTVEGGYIFNVSKIILEVDAVLDSHIYDLAENILKNFPGILVLHKLSVRRNELVKGTHPFALASSQRPNLVCGELVFEWFSMGGNKSVE
jgi:hypothetical protein